MRKLSLFIIFNLIFTIYGKVAFSQSLESIINSKNRTASYVERDKYRNPLDTLNFFKINNNY